MGITGKIYGINGPVITIQGNPGYKMNEMVYVGEHRLVGEVIRLSKEKTTIQVYEETSGLKPGEEVAGAGCAISVKLAPGILNNIFDDNERPLQKIAEKSGAYIPTGAQADALKPARVRRRPRAFPSPPRRHHAQTARWPRARRSPRPWTPN